MTRLPELYEQLQEGDAVPDASQALELDELVRSVPKLIGILPDVLRDRSDVRHNAALAEMIAGLVVVLDKVQPLALVCVFFFEYVCGGSGVKTWLDWQAQSQIRPMLVHEAVRLGHLQSTALERFHAAVAVS
jgi:nuclear pore complex protein Nup98-Nup96